MLKYTPFKDRRAEENVSSGLAHISVSTHLRPHGDLPRTWLSLKLIEFSVFDGFLRVPTQQECLQIVSPLTSVYNAPIEPSQEVIKPGDGYGYTNTPVTGRK